MPAPSSRIRSGEFEEAASRGSKFASRCASTQVSTPDLEVVRSATRLRGCATGASMKCWNMRISAAVIGWWMTRSRAPAANFEARCAIEIGSARQSADRASRRCRSSRQLVEDAVYAKIATTRKRGSGLRNPRRRPPASAWAMAKRAKTSPAPASASPRDCIPPGPNRPRESKFNQQRFRLHSHVLQLVGSSSR